jgi:hypothetical protein
MYKNQGDLEKALDYLLRSLKIQEEIKNKKGISGTFLWKKFNLLNNDLVHFTKEGYALQGSLFTDAFLSAYELYKQNKNKHLNLNTNTEKNTEDRIKLKSR